MPTVFLSHNDRFRLMRVTGTSGSRERATAARALLLLHAGFSPLKVRMLTALPSHVIVGLTRRVEREGIRFLEVPGLPGFEVGMLDRLTRQPNPPARLSEGEKMRRLQRLMPSPVVLASLASRPSTEGIDVESDPAELYRPRTVGPDRPAV